MKKRVTIDDKFMQRALDAASESGDTLDKKDAAYLVSSRSQMLGELDDQFKGVRKTSEHLHHKPYDLVQSLCTNATSIVGLRKRLEGR